MAAPTKPWERAGINYQNPGSLPANNMSGYALSDSQFGNISYI